jgi:hypothetical protein
MLPDLILISLAHSLPILVSRFCTKSRITLGIVTAIVAMLTVNTAEPQNKASTFFVIAVAWYVCDKSIRSSKATSTITLTQRTTQKSSSHLDSAISGIIVVAVVALFYFYFVQKANTSTPATPTRESSARVPNANLELAKKHSSSSPTRHTALKPSLSSRLQIVASEMNSAVPKPFGDHLTLLNAAAKGNSLSISMQITKDTAMDIDAQTGRVDVNGSIGHYFCGLESYRQLISEGATFIAQLRGNDGVSISVYPITESVCRA